jgi:SAM-dependent methyltransferase
VTRSRPYAGAELETFEAAVRWKSYWARHVGPFVAGDVLEVGAGIGANTAVLAGERVRRWVCLEPDGRLADRIARAIREGRLPAYCRVVRDTLPAIDRTDRFDAVLYLDVLEHIEDDRGELGRAAAHLRPGGALVVLAPAHQWLFSPFDRAIGHHRRYDRGTLTRVVPPGLAVERLVYLDSVGLLASLANRLVLRAEAPSPGQVRFWDSTLVPCSRRVDPLLGHRVGKSILGVWRAPGDP